MKRGIDICIEAYTGFGKTTNVLVQLVDLISKPAVVSTSLRPARKKTAEVLKQHGYDVLELKGADELCKVGWEPLKCAECKIFCDWKKQRLAVKIPNARGVLVKTHWYYSRDIDRYPTVLDEAHVFVAGRIDEVRRDIVLPHYHSNVVAKLSATMPESLCRGALFIVTPPRRPKIFHLPHISTSYDGLDPVQLNAVLRELRVEAVIAPKRVLDAINLSIRKIALFGNEVEGIDLLDVQRLAVAAPHLPPEFPLPQDRKREIEATKALQALGRVRPFTRSDVKIFILGYWDHIMSKLLRYYDVEKYSL